MEDQIKPVLVKVPSHFSVTDVVSVTGGGGHTLIITGYMLRCQMFSPALHPELDVQILVVWSVFCRMQNWNK